ncbi:FimV/HubP family polar landmark protein [Psychrobacter proteolyticus]|uniref:FimV/HubP family polar landmark protein n=1 Tax=Psychrobacter proteolyticus TaxID=147825 RepID=UPI003D079DE7
MDNMLYIIAGLVLILLIAGFLLRKNKAHKQSAQPPVSSVRNDTAPAPKTDYGTPAQSNQNDSNKFDNITIAQRFVDQQRYDKAIEAINRGLNEKPNDSQLSIKLLSIYATLDQPENFNNVYDTIKIHNDAKTLTLANELKDLYVGEQSPTAVQELVTEDNQASFDALDFDLSTTDQVDDAAEIAEHPVVEDSHDAVIDKPIDSPVFSNEIDDINPNTENAEDSFDLTLSDLEEDFNEPDADNEAHVTPLSITDNDNLHTSTSDSADTIKNDNVIEDHDLSDFEFDFDAPTETTSIETSDVPDVRDSTNETLALEDDFILDFDDLSADADKDIVVTNDGDTNTQEYSIDATQSSEDDFALSLESLDTSDNINTTSNDVLPATENNDNIDNFIFEDIDFADNTSENLSLKDDIFADINLEETLLKDETEITDVEESNIAPDEPLVFDDSKLIDDNFDLDDTSSLFDSPSDTEPVSTAAPVEAETSVPTQDTESAEEFSSRFAADFDFVKSLDSNQVTLDLAGQYLQLGEYDSAKRLLNEVIAQGNSEQKQQAKLLLERTA